MGGIVTIDFEDPAAPRISRVKFDFAAQDYSLVVVDTGGTHADLTDDYAAVPTEMKAVAAMLGKQVLRQTSRAEVLKRLPELRAKCGDRAVLRALHFLGDNERVVDQVTALEEGRFTDFLSLVSDSGNSSYKRLQNIYSPHHVEEQGVALALALTEGYLHELGQGACRVHGGGFAGTIQVFLPNLAVEAYAALLEPVFGEGSVHVLNIRPLGATHLNSLR
jgi:galactokinase